MEKLLDKIKNDLKSAMREKKEVRRQALRMFLAAVKNKEIELKKRDSLSEEQIVQVIKSEIKKRKDSIEAYTAGKRPDLADREKEEADILKKYMPKELSEAEIEKAIAVVISGFTQAGPGDFGKIMGAVMGKIKNQADGNTVSKLVKKALGK